MANSLSGIFDQTADYGTATPPSGDFGLLPDGEYAGAIETAELVTTAKGGKMIKLAIRLDNNRMVWDNLNVDCPSSAKAQEIALRNLKTIADSNNRKIRSDEDLEGCSVTVMIGTQQGTNGYKDRNVVRFYNSPAPRSPAPAQARRAPSAAQSHRPVTVNDPRYRPSTPDVEQFQENRAKSTEEFLGDTIPF